MSLWQEVSKYRKEMETTCQLVVWIPQYLLPQWNFSNNEIAVDIGRFQFVQICIVRCSFCRGLIDCDRRSRSSSYNVIAVIYHINAVGITGQVAVVFSACWVMIWYKTVESIWRGILESWAVFLMMITLLSLGLSAVFSAFAYYGSPFSYLTECSG